MSAWSTLPNELLLHVLWLSDYKDVLRVRLVNRRCKALIDSSSQLNLLIELGRDDQYPIYSAGFNNTPLEALNLHLRKRDRWSQFLQPIPLLMPLQDHKFHIYEFAGGLLAACIAGSTTDTISIQSTEGETRETAHEYEGPPGVRARRQVPLPFKCAEFSFDPTQDLLVIVEDLIPKFPVHIFSLSTNTYHSKAAQPIFDKFVDTRTQDIDIEITIDESIVSLAYKPLELHGNVCTAVLNWKTGQVLFHQLMSGATSASLMSPRYLMAIRCGYDVSNPSLDIYDLAFDNVSRDTGPPLFRLLLPGLALIWWMQNMFEASYFIHGTQNSSYADSLSGIARNGETDLICIQIRMSAEDRGEPPLRLYLFVSKTRLLQLVSIVFGELSEANLNPGTIQEDSVAMEIVPDHSSTSTTNERNPIRDISYNEWSDSGRLVRWIDGSNLHGMTRCGVLGSKFACIGNPYDLGLPRDIIFDNSDRQFVCMLEFNEGLPSDGDGQDGPNFFDESKPISPLLEDINANVRGGLTYKIKWFENPTTAPCFDVLLGSDCVMVRLMEGFEVYKM